MRINIRVRNQLVGISCVIESFMLGKIFESGLIPEGQIELLEAKTKKWPSSNGFIQNKH